MSLEDDKKTEVSFGAESEMDSDREHKLVRADEILNVASIQVLKEDKPSLINGMTELSEDGALRVPVLPIAFLSCNISQDKMDMNVMDWQNNASITGAVGEIKLVTVIGDVRLSGSGARKEKREIQIDISGTEFRYWPGDAFYFICPNPRPEVNCILQRLGLLQLADNKMTVTLHKNTLKKNAAVPIYIPETCSLRYLFTFCLDIRRSPSRSLLRILAEQANDFDKRRLLELCSSQGVQEYTRFVRQAAVSLADILHTFPSTMPPIERLIEHLPRLLPRPYSAACAQSRSPDRVRFAYSLMDFPIGQGRSYDRMGLCTAWMSGLSVGDTVKVAMKEAARFRLPMNEPERVPLMLIGPGTGVAPFIGFLQQILNETIRGNSCSNVQRWLLFGCRNTTTDFIYRDEMEAFQREGILSQLIVCESQPSDVGKRYRYVQDALKARSDQVTDFLTNNAQWSRPSQVYVCGDAKGMSKDIWEAFIEIISIQKNLSKEEATEFMASLKHQNRYIEDVWS